MSRPRLRRTLVVALAAGLLLPGLAGVPVARAAAPHEGAPPGVDPARPTVSGRLVAKATDKAPAGAVVCGPRTATPTRMVNRGLVICTEDGKLVLLQLSKSTNIFNSDWQRIGYARLAIGDRLNAWGILRDGGTVLNPTVTIEDLSQSGPRQQMVSGRLVAKPDAAPSGPVVCGDRDRTGDAQALAVTRGLVICTEEGKLILLQISGSTKLLSHDRARVTIEDLTLGDMLNAWGRLTTGGSVLKPTVSVVDVNLQRGGTNSQDFIANGGQVLTLFVLKSDAGPVEGRIFASPGEPTHVTLCGGRKGTWADLKQGLTVNISHSIFNTRTMGYVDTSVVSVVSCA